MIWGTKDFLTWLNFIEKWKFRKDQTIHCNFLVYDFWTPPPMPPFINFVHDHLFFIFQQISIHTHVAAALGPLACSSRSARPRNELNLT